MKHFLKHPLMENSILLKGLKRPNTKTSKIACLSKTLFCKFTLATNRIGVCIHQQYTLRRLVVWVEGAEYIRLEICNGLFFTNKSI